MGKMSKLTKFVVGGSYSTHINKYKRGLNQVSKLAGNKKHKLQKMQNQKYKEGMAQAKLLANQEKSIDNKINKIDKELEAINQSLKILYIDGKIEKTEYLNLQERINEIFDVVVFGGKPGVHLAKRYVTGKIDKKKYKEFEKEVLPQEITNERQNAQKTIDTFLNEMNNFLHKCNGDSGNNCAFCNKESSLFSPTKECCGIKFCKQHKIEIDILKKYNGFDGKYFLVEAFEIKSLNTKSNVIIQAKTILDK